MSLFNTEFDFLAMTRPLSLASVGVWRFKGHAAELDFQVFFFSCCGSSGEFPICINPIMTTHFCPRACVTEITARYQNPMLRTSISEIITAAKMGCRAKQYQYMKAKHGKQRCVCEVFDLAHNEDAQQGTGICRPSQLFQSRKSKSCLFSSSLSLRLFPNTLRNITRILMSVHILKYIRQTMGKISKSEWGRLAIQLHVLHTGLCFLWSRFLQAQRSG